MFVDKVLRKPLVNKKRIASIDEMQCPEWKQHLKDINSVVSRINCDLKEYWTYNRSWEYPWLWKQLRQLRGLDKRILDNGSERSPFPWFLSEQGFELIVSDVTKKYLGIWRKSAKHIPQHSLKRLATKRHFYSS